MLEEVIVPMKFPFPVADTEEGPSIHWENFDLILKFVDYQNNICSLKFGGVCHFSLFAETQNMSTKYFYDSVCEIQNSNLIESLIISGDIGKNEKDNYKHIVIGFNEISSFLEVVYEDMQIMQA